MRLIKKVENIMLGVVALFVFMGICLLYLYAYVAAPDEPTRIGWWAAITIVLAVLFGIVYLMISEYSKSLEVSVEREMRKKERAVKKKV